MLTSLRKTLGIVAFSLAISVISLAGAALAVSIPVPTNLKPFADGIRSPLGVARDSAGNVYVADPQAGGVLKYNQYGYLTKLIKMARPAQAVAVAADGRLLVSQGGYVSMLDQNGAEAGRLEGFRMANGIAVDAAGFIYVVDSIDNSVRVFAANGASANKFGTYGTANGQFSTPTGIAYEKISNQLAVVDSRNGRIQFFDVNGVFQKSIGSTGSNPLQFNLPQGVAFEYDNATAPALKRMYVVDTFQGNVQAIDPTGAGVFLSYMGGYGFAGGQLQVPSALLFDQANSRLLVANGAGRVNSYGIDGGTNPTKTTPPTVTIDQFVSPIATDSQVITGTVEPGATVAVSVNTAAVIGTVTQPTAGTWSVTLSGLKAGENQISVTATDQAWNTATVTASIAYLLPAPTLSIDPVAAITNQLAPMIGGQVEAGATVVVNNASNGKSGAATLNGNAWSYALPLASGTNNVTVKASKPGSSEAVSTFSIILDTEPPSLMVSALPDKSYTSEQVQNLSLQVADANLEKVTINGQAVAPVNGAYSTAVNLVLGANTITVSARDLAGNVTTDSRTITFDNILPLLSVDSPADNSYTTAAALTVSGQIDDPATTITVAGMPAMLADKAWTAQITLIPGINTVDIQATDLAGNVTSLKRTVILDVNRPELAITIPAQDVSTNQGAMAFAGTFADSDPVTITAEVNGVPLKVAQDGASFGFPVELAGEGAYAVTVRATDVAGNVTTATRTILHDVTPPQLTVNPVAGYPALLSGTVDAGALVNVEDKNGPVRAALVANGAWSADLSSLSFDLSTLAVRASDAAGNATVKNLTLIVPDGDMNGDGVVNMTDVMIALNIYVKRLTPSANQLAHGDLGPVVNGVAKPDGRIDLSDVMLIMDKYMSSLRGKR